MLGTTAIRVVLGATIVALCSEAGYAEDVPPPTPAPTKAEKVEHVIIDSTADTGHGGKSFDFNATFAPFGSIYETGFRIRLTPSYSWYQYKLDDTGTLGSGYSVESDILPGIGVATPRASFIVLVGPAFVQSYDSGRTKSQQALKTVASVYATPTDRTMFYGSFNYITLGSGYQMQLKTGLKVPLGFYLGPEIKLSGSNGNMQTRLGAHLSALKVGNVFFSFTGGFLHDDQLGPGQFVSVNLYTTF
jgi:opacity protein-like surface antigen